MSADLLRQAASLMRQRAEAATDGPWGFGGSGVSTFYVDWLPSGTWAYRDDAPHRVIAGTHDTSERAIKESPKTWMADLRQDSANGEHIASWHPAVALAVADWLDTAGADLWAHGLHCAEGCHECDDDLWAPHVRRALAVARAYLGDTP